MDQVQSPIFVGQNYIFMAADGKYINIKCPNKPLSKYQFTMNVVLNATRGIYHMDDAT